MDRQENVGRKKLPVHAGAPTLMIQHLRTIISR